MRTGAPAAHAVAGALFVSSLTVPGMAQVFTENAGVISPEAPILRESASFLLADRLRELRTTSQWIMGFTPRIETNVSLPVVFRDVEVRGPSGAKQSHDDVGLGDLALKGKLSLFQADDVMASTRFAALAEVAAPTGDDDEEHGGSRLPRRLQLGLGAWGFGGGAAFTAIRDRHRGSVELFYRHRLPHDGLELGDELSWNLAYWYRLRPARFDPSKEEELEVRGVVELLSTYRFLDRGRAAGRAEEGFLLWAAPGVQIYPKKFLLLEASLLVPYLQTLRDAAGSRQLGGLFAVKVLF